MSVNMDIAQYSNGTCTLFSENNIQQKITAEPKQQWLSGFIMIDVSLMVCFVRTNNANYTDSFIIELTLNNKLQNQRIAASAKFSGFTAVQFFII